MTLPPEAELIAAALACLDGNPGAADGAAKALTDCMASDSYTLTVNVATGDLPAVLIDFRTVARCFGTVSAIAWWDSEWHVQSAEGLMPNTDPGTLITNAPNTNYPYEDRSRLVAGPDGTYLGIIQANAECGSGAPDEGYLLLQLQDDQWRLAWDSQTDSRTSFGYPAMSFIGDGIDHLRIEGNSFSRQDSQRQIFFESKLAPHRLFEQQWVRDGHTYHLESEAQIPTPYGRLVDFVYAISHQANSATQDMVTDPAFVQKAIDLGLVQDPIGQEWIGYCGDGAPMASPPCSIDVPDGPVVVLDMVEVDGHWRISSIEAQ